MPKVSVIIPTYNRKEYLEIAIRSAINQTYRDVEVLILDDCSTDNTTEIFDDYEYTKFVRCIVNQENIGFIRNWNKGVGLSSGEYIKIMGDDDLLEISCIAKQVAILDNNPDVGIVCCDYFIINEDGMIENNNDLYRLFDRDTKEDGISFMSKYLLGRRRAGWPTSILFRRQDFDKVGGFDVNAGVAADIDMWCRILRDSKFYYIDKKLAYNRQFKGLNNLSKRMDRSGKEYFLTELTNYLKTARGLNGGTSTS